MTSSPPRCVVVAPDKFKGSLTAAEAAEAIAAGVRRAYPHAEVRVLPVADGGEGTTDAVVAAGFTRRQILVKGPTGDGVRASFAIRGDNAVVEMAEASGMGRLTSGVPSPTTASTFGTGQLIRAALDAGARRIVLGVGGSATTDGGAGMAHALGAGLLDRAGRQLPPGGAALADVDRIVVDGLDPRLADTTVDVATDVDNPLTGPRGAAAVYGPQKGATPDDIERLDAALTRYAAVLARDLGADVAAVPGAGAAGGLGAGAMAFLSATPVSGIVAVLSIVGFEEALAGADLVITGEGSMDEQSLNGKAPIGVAAAAARAGVPVTALVGRLELTASQLAGAGIGHAMALLDVEPDLHRAQANAGPLLSDLAERAVRSR